MIPDLPEEKGSKIESCNQGDSFSFLSGEKRGGEVGGGYRNIKVGNVLRRQQRTSLSLCFVLGVLSFFFFFFFLSSPFSLLVSIVLIL